MIVWFDLEATCWKEDRVKQRDESEIIEIGAVKETGEIFDGFIKPVKNPVLSDFCKSLTGISQDTVDRGCKFPEVLEQFRAFIGENPILCSWGYYDKNKLIEDAVGWKMESVDLRDWKSDWEWKHVNLSKVYRRIMNCRKIGLDGAIRERGMKIEGRRHSGIDDAKNVKRIYEDLKQFKDFNEVWIKNMEVVQL